MRRILLVTLSLPLFGLSALAQNAANAPVAAPVAPATSTAVPTTLGPAVKPLSLAPTTVAPAPNPVSVAAPPAPGSNMGTDTPAAGANSFTEAQARSRLEQNGYTGVSALKKNDNGVWQGTAQRDGKAVSVSLDYKGDIITR